MIFNLFNPTTVTFCKGCCCGNTDKGNFALPLDYLEEEYPQSKQKELGIRIVISDDCLGICSPANLAILIHGGKEVWLQDLRSKKNYQDIMGWAELSAKTKKFAPLPISLKSKKR